MGFNIGSYLLKYPGYVSFFLLHCVRDISGTSSKRRPLFRSDILMSIQ